MKQSPTSHNTHQEPVSHWYQEPWVWFILTVIFVSVTWGSYRVYFAFQNADQVVVDDYYKVGKAINQDLSRDHLASELKIAGRIVVKPESGAIEVEMKGDVDNWPQQLRMHIMPTAPKEENQTLALVQTPARENFYRGQPRNMPIGRYYIQIETLDELVPEVGFKSGWRLNREVRFEPGMPVELTVYE